MSELPRGWVEQYDRPDRLPQVAQYVIWACRPERDTDAALSDGEKIVWYHIWLLDFTPIDGAWISSRSLGERIGKSAKTIESIRARLLALDLAAAFRRKGANQPGWVAKLPLSLIPKSRSVSGAVLEAPALAAKLVERIRGFDAGVITSIEEGNRSASTRKPVPRGDGGRFRQIAEGDSAAARSASAVGGDGGGASSSHFGAQATAPSAFTETGKAEGVGAIAPKGEKERPTTRELARAEQAANEAAFEAGMEHISDTIRRSVQARKP